MKNARYQTPGIVWLSAGFIVAVLIVLIVLPLSIGWRVSEVRNQIDGTSSVALQHARELRRSFLNEISDLLYWRITGQREYLQEFIGHQHEVETQLREIAIRAPEMGADVEAGHKNLTQSLADWRQLVVPIAGEAGEGVPDEALLRQNVLVRSV